MTTFSARKSTQNLYFGIPLSDFFGTNTTGDDQEDGLDLLHPCLASPEPACSFPLLKQMGFYMVPSL